MADKQETDVTVSPLPSTSPDTVEQRVGQLLIEESLIDPAKLETAWKIQAERGGGLVDILLEIKALTTDALYAFLSRQSGAPSIDLGNYEIPRELATLITKDFAWSHLVLPIDKMGRLLTVGMANPLDTPTIGEIERITGLRVKVMLCKHNDIRAAIRRYYPRDLQEYDDVIPEVRITIPPTKTTQPAFETTPKTIPTTPTFTPVQIALTREHILEQLEQIPLLPPAPGAIARLKTICNRVISEAGTGKTIRDIASVVGSDPALALECLRIANNRAHGMVGRVCNINLATILVGIPGINRLIHQFDDAPTIPPTAQFDQHTFWVRSMFCAIAAMSMIKTKGGQTLADAYTAGFLHHIGCLALVLIDEGINTPPLGTPSAEKETLGITHAEAGYILAKRWRLPQDILLPIRFHHDPYSGAEGNLVAEVALGAIMAEAFEKGETMTKSTFDLYKPQLTEIGISPSQAAQIFTQAAAALKAATRPPGEES